MAVERQAQFLGQLRVDAPQLRSLESGVAGDFDMLAGQLIAGGRALVVSGFEAVATLGTPALTLSLTVAGAKILHPLASDAGTIHRVPATRAAEILNTTNLRVSGSFTASALNYVGVDLRRTADATTADIAQFLDPSLLVENAQQIPMARTFDYVIVISPQDFSVTPNIAPLYKVTLDANSNMTVVEDARNLAFRLGSGGSLTNTKNAYAWPAGRTEVGDNSDYHVGDKVIGSLKEWMDATMTRLWELGGGQRWYSPTADRNVTFIRGIAAASPFTGGEFFEWTGTNLHWKALAFLSDNSTATVNEIADQTTDVVGLTDLADGQCIYVDLDRTTTRTVGGANALIAVKGTLATLGTPVIPGSRQILAWRYGASLYVKNQYFSVGTAFAIATPTALGMVKLSATAGAPAAPLVVSCDSSVNAQAAGLTRGALGAGTLTIGINGTDTISVGAPTTFAGILVKHTAAALSSFVPQEEYLDSASNIRWVRDRNGYPMASGRTEMYVSWIKNIAGGTNTATLAGPVGWNFNVVGGTPTYGSVAPSATYPSPAMSLSTAGALADQGVVYSDKWIHLGAAFLTAVFEFDVMVSILQAGAQYYVGLCDTSAGHLAPNAIYFNWRNTDPTEWQGQTTAASVGTATFTAVPPVAGTIQRLKIEIYGSGSPAAAQTVNFYINGNKVGSSTTNIPTTAMSFFFSQQNSIGTTNTLTVGNIHAVWNNVLSLPAS